MHSCLSESVAPVAGVRIWTSYLDSLSNAGIAELRGYLNSAERARGARFHFECDRQRYTAARGLLRSLLSAVLNEPASTLAFGYGPHGKPALVNANHRESRLRFNLSHSAGWAMFAVADYREVGIDLESRRRLDQTEDELARLAARVLSAREMTIWQTLPHFDARHAAFLRAWTRKEAYGKATGRGVFEAMAKIEVMLDAAAPTPSLTIPALESGSGLTSDWLLHDLAAPEGFAAALVVERKAEEDVAGSGGGVFAPMNNAKGSTPRSLRFWRAFTQIHH